VARILADLNLPAAPGARFAGCGGLVVLVRVGQQFISPGTLMLFWRDAEQVLLDTFLDLGSPEIWRRRHRGSPVVRLIPLQCHADGEIRG
jgi:hypothetical protein